MVELTKEQDLETLRQISLLLDRENQRLITKTLDLTAELARLQGLSHPEQLQLAVLQDVQRRRAQVFQPHADPASASPAQPKRPAPPGHVRTDAPGRRFVTNSRPRTASAPRAAAS